MAASQILLFSKTESMANRMFSTQLRDVITSYSIHYTKLYEAIKDMAGLLKPAAAKVLVGALKDEIGLPIHLHSHDTSGIASATLLAAADAGVDAIDAAMDSMSGLTSHPNLGSIVAALKNTPRDTGMDLNSLNIVSSYWEKVRQMYIGFESEYHSGTSEVYLHEMPRITSYNVCYTKLLRAFLGMFNLGSYAFHKL